MHETFEKHHFDCDCGSDEHTFSFTFDNEEGDLYMAAHLHQYRNVFKRMWVAIKYVCGYKSKYGHWDTTQLNVRDSQRLADLCIRSIQVRKAFHQRLLDESEARKAASAAEMQALREDVQDVQDVHNV